MRREEAECGEELNVPKEANLSEAGSATDFEVLGC